MARGKYPILEKSKTEEKNLTTFFLSNFKTSEVSLLSDFPPLGGPSGTDRFFLGQRNHQGEM